MSLGLLGGIISSLSGPLGTVAERYFDNKDEQQAFKNAVELEILKNQSKFQDLSSEIVLAEAKSEHKLTAIWRPATMLLFALVIVINILIIPYILVPILWLLGVPLPEIMPIPDQVWTLITVGLGGYVGGRSGEKMVRAYKEK